MQLGQIPSSTPLDPGVFWRERIGRWRPRPPLTVSAWADQFRILARARRRASPGRGGRRARRTCARSWTRCRPIPRWRRSCSGPARSSGKSECCNNWIGYSIDHNPGPVLLVQPTLDLAKRYSKQRIASLIDSTPCLRGRVQPARARDSGNTLLEKEFDGGILVIAGANSAAGLRSMPARDLLFDEVDAYPLMIDDEGDPISLAEKRQDTFTRRKRLKTSTCTIKGESRIEQSYLASDRRRYWLPCPHCGEYQVLRWANLKWQEDDPETAAYACEHCGAMIAETAQAGHAGRRRVARRGARRPGTRLLAEQPVLAARLAVVGGDRARVPRGQGRRRPGRPDAAAGLDQYPAGRDLGAAGQQDRRARRAEAGRALRPAHHPARRAAADRLGRRAGRSPRADDPRLGPRSGILGHRLRRSCTATRPKRSSGSSSTRSSRRRSRTPSASSCGCSAARSTTAGTMRCRSRPSPAPEPAAT